MAIAGAAMLERILRGWKKTKEIFGGVGCNLFRCRVAHLRELVREPAAVDHHRTLAPAQLGVRIRVHARGAHALEARAVVVARGLGVSCGAENQASERGQGGGGGPFGGGNGAAGNRKIEFQLRFAF